MDKQFAFCFQRLVIIFSTNDKKDATEIYLQTIFLEATEPRFCKNQRLGQTSILLCTKIISMSCYFIHLDDSE